MRRWFTRLSITLIATAVCTGCSCPNTLTAPQMVNTAPLEAARLSPDIQSVLPLFPKRAATIVSAGRHENGDPNPSGIIEWVALASPLMLNRIQVEVRLYRSEDAASKEFTEWERVSRSDPMSCTNFAFGGTPGNRCIISDSQRWRIGGDVPFSCAHETTYHSVVAFQKQNIVIWIDEHSPEPGGKAKDGVIEALAVTLSQGSPYVRSIYEE